MEKKAVKNNFSDKFSCLFFIMLNQDRMLFHILYFQKFLLRKGRRHTQTNINVPEIRNMINRRNNHLFVLQPGLPNNPYL